MYYIYIDNQPIKQGEDRDSSQLTCQKMPRVNMEYFVDLALTIKQTNGNKVEMEESLKHIYIYLERLHGLLFIKLNHHLNYANS